MRSYILDSHVNETRVSQALHQRCFAFAVFIENLAERNDIIGQRTGAELLHRKLAIAGSVLAVPDKMSVSGDNVNVLEFLFANGLQEACEFAPKPADLAIGFALEGMSRKLNIVVLVRAERGRRIHHNFEIRIALF